ncbi:cyclopropane fatty acyl phospholipid synthase [Pendulispora brunnea]|uniref:Cyclopropane fatty acyl phospholipid synthase n=1 Tax=Pendulispora brunnea TaxID=2905690 RepID=A0ABZ2KDX3_9BACT
MITDTIGAAPRSANAYEKLVRDIFASAGIPSDGSTPHAIRVRNPAFYHRFLRDGTLGLGETYMDAWWDCDDLPEMMARFAKAGISRRFRLNPRFILNRFRAKLLNEGNVKNALFGVRKHYDIGNDLFAEMLDPLMVYTCGYWNEANNLADAQVAKMELICRKLDLRPGMRVLDIGCGWGSLLKYAAQRYGIVGVGVSNSVQQLLLARDLCTGLPIEFLERDYRAITGKFDRILSVGMFEHVGYQNHRTYMEVVDRCLDEGGLSLLHTMGRTASMTRGNDQWITKYIFPNTQVPSLAQIGTAIDGLFVLEDVENLSTDYEKTLLAWHENFVQNWPRLAQGTRASYGDETFRRMWEYYLLIFAGWFRARSLQLWQFVLSKGGCPGGYPWQKERRVLWARA